jgi:Zn-dependent M28 family amino/carboxypeptidase
MLLALFLSFVPAGLEGTRVAASRFARQAPAAPARAARIDGDRQMADLRTLSSPDMEGRHTGSPGNRKAQQIILERFTELQLKPVNGSYLQKFAFTSTRRGTSQAFPDAVNLMAMVTGTAEPSSFVIVGAHYDHLGVRDGQIFHGADDNASGVAAMLSIASWFARHPARKSLLFVAFDAEEQGLEGAKYFVANPPVDLKRVTAMVNIDMIGRGDAGTLFVAGTSHYPVMKPVATDAGAGRQLTVKLGHDTPGTGSDDWTFSSDHGPFHRAGIPFLYFGVEDHPDYHKPTDTADKIPRAFYLDATEVVLDAVARLAGEKGGGG